MEFTATEEQVKQIVCNAINASVPIGLGILGLYDSSVKQYTLSEVQDPDGSFDLDYFHGRMVKLCIIPVIGQLGENKGTGERCWKIIRPDYPPNIEYQSWAKEYPTLEELVGSIIQ